MNMKLKDFTVRVKAPEDGVEDQGIIEAYASVFGNRDSYGDVVMQGAFTETLEEWAASGNTIPLIYGHDLRDPFSNIGSITSAVEDERGLKITAQFDLDNAKAKQVYRLVKDKRLTQMSFGYDVVEGAEIELEDDWAYVIRRVRLYEISVVPIGANDQTEITSVKSAEVDENVRPINHLRARILLLEKGELYES